MSFGIVPRLQNAVCSSPIVANNPRIRAFLEHPAGPFTSKLPRFSHWIYLSQLPLRCSPFSCPGFQMGTFCCRHQRSGAYLYGCWTLQFISLANVSDLNRPADKLSTSQQIAISATGLIWSRYSMVITPVNWNLFSVNIFMAATGLYQLYRIATNDGVEPVETPKKAQ